MQVMRGLVISGGVLLVLGLVLGLRPLGDGCGSVLRADDSGAAIRDAVFADNGLLSSAAAACEVSRSHWLIPVWLLIGLGLAALLAALVILAARRSSASQHA